MLLWCRLLENTGHCCPRYRYRRGSHVINFELPNVPEDYVHRIGRTARAGAAGIAIALCRDEERPHLRDIEKLTRCPLPAIPPPSATPAPRDGPIERPASSKLRREGPLASRQGPASARGAPTRHPPRSASAEFRRGEPPTGGSPPALRRRPSRTKSSGVCRRDEQQGSAVATRFDAAR